MIVYSVGLVVGALASGGAVWVLMGLLSPLPQRAAAIVVLTAALLGAARDFKLLRFSLPENRRLVPDRVFEKGFALGSFQFGVEMGTGARTYVPSTTPYVLVVALALLGSGAATVAGAAIGFAAGRAAVLWTRAIALDQIEWERRSPTASRTVVRVAALEYLALAPLLVWMG